MFYRYLIYLVAFFLIGGAGYYFHLVGVPDLIVSDIKNDDNRGNGASATQVFSGTYVCDHDSGCEHTTRIILEEDTTLDIITTIDGQDTSLAQGTWGVGTGGALIFKFNNNGDFSSTSPSSLIAKKVSSLKITGFSTTKGLYPGMKNPTFTRIEEEKKDNTPMTPEDGTTTDGS